jgi:hypothetical protein
MFSAELDDGFRGLPCGYGVAAEYFEEGLEQIGLGQSRGMS